MQRRIVVFSVFMAPHLDVFKAFGRGRQTEYFTNPVWRPAKEIDKWTTNIDTHKMLINSNMKTFVQLRMTNYWAFLFDVYISKGLEKSVMESVYLYINKMNVDFLTISHTYESILMQ